ncbi:30S ribosomal protein S6 [Candidatus Amesbacteria bacterium RIFCSPHIGHO2_01_FULL_48_32]|uniref:Small ribosomal subunit protein bS6 n=1 Tax=Candidatus Amesbacteria bacterium RIFCSPLOWO2_01_FULL_48_25 TaxID=1797259 RepID=A0A1F4ZBG2_9BACT|nr:MAG: 30S ribosomal protein S6 [Candidatus Amesbacteria bacterium RIFCSPHIGHO2_01_FULL_48_32]OGD03709.1 MAG: 30S ribosomal protein S6 [Candidatus Amesbacteria bacterium RIFCSPLOWO2_01_FULL_48_25]HJZ05943.1 30S ribosomal protein S6 [Patescibacteria group bacterium]
MKKYELTILATDLAGLVEKIEKLVKVLKGGVEKVTEMGKKPLAFTIKKAGEAHYLSLDVELPGESVVQLRKKLSVDKVILRYLLVKK